MDVKLYYSELKSAIESRGKVTVTNVVFKLKKTYPDIHEYIDSTFSLYSTKQDASLVEKVWMILNHSTAKICSQGKQLKFDQWALGYVYCSKRCACAKAASQATMMEKYGVAHALQSAEFKEKQTATLNERFGTTIVSAANKKQAEATCMQKYDAKTPLESTKVRNKIKDTNIERYGSSTPFERSDIQTKIQAKWLAENGTNSYIKTEEQILRFRDKVLDEKFGPKAEYLKVPEKLTLLLRTMTRDKAAEFIGCSTRVIDKRVIQWDLKEFQVTSYYENLISQFLTSLGIEFISNTRKVIAPKELDFYIPSKNLAIEFNGLHWHSEVLGKKDSKYHLQKTEACAEKGIRLIHIFQDEWDNNPDIVKSIIKNALGLTPNKIYARKCTVKEISNTDYISFMNVNHLQGGSVGTNIRLGLYYNDILVSAMSFKKTAYGTELSRFVTQLDTTVVGGSQKLFNYATKNFNLPDLYTFSDRRYFTGSVYQSLGFKFDSFTKPSYHYFISANKRYDRTHFMKHKLSALLEVFDPEKSEWENMKDNDYDRIWDCGHYKFKFPA